MTFYFPLLIIATTLRMAFAFDTTDSPLLAAEKWGSRSQMEHPECLQSTGATAEEVHDFFELVGMSTRYEFKCYIDCLFKSFGFINEDGTIEGNALVQQVEIYTDEMVDFCREPYLAMEDQCERAYELSHCLTHYKHSYF
ncbi:uncharacterized protein LOC116181377 [Photinus pyralis]|uniref:uncharacterized protein LOC116181086 n=1 Tax=Photinus pyralis TaxID=7054 RepID=UPI0012675140|nr:uncharacterized protein LOC116181086 [Photinus pyralis]XP_031357589.1 uncharacterized protein LOC116181377 [Photinus pyralis]